MRGIPPLPSREGVRTVELPRSFDLTTLTRAACGLLRYPFSEDKFLAHLRTVQLSCLQGGLSMSSVPQPAAFRQIRKRDGELESFELMKIAEAIAKAGRATGEFTEEIARRLSIRVLATAQSLLPEVPTVEQIQDIVEEVLIGSTFKKTAKAYILYRDQHEAQREISEKADLSLVDSYLDKLDWRVNENSNMAFSLQGLNNFVASEVTKTYWLRKIYPPEVRQAHLSGDLHLHDLGLLSVYCVGWDLQDLLLSGFRGVAGKAESRPARHFRTALGQIVNFFYTLQGEAAGAQAFSSFDTLLAPFVRKDRLGLVEVKQALQEFVFNLNVPTRVGFQTPFTNLTMDLKPPATLAGQAAIIGGEYQGQNYGEFQAEMDLINQAFLDVLVEGDARGRVFTFPIPTYNITKDFDWDGPARQRLWEVTARYGIPYFANFVNSDLSPEDARSMCCRLRLDMRSLQRRGGGLFGANPLTGSIGVVTINLPRLGGLSSGEAEFLNRLDRQLEIAKVSLEIKRKVLEQFTDRALYPYSRYYLRSIKERTGNCWSNHFSTIGILGMNEACQNLLGCSVSDPQGKALALRVLDHLRGRLAGFQDETGHLYNLEATPAEGTSYRLAKEDKQRYPHLRCANEDDFQNGAKPFYTNSTQLPVNHTDDIFEVLDHQDDLQARYTGGTVQHVFLGEEVTDTRAVQRFVQKVCESYRMPYFTLTPTFSICPDHGYLRGKVPTCPQCGARTEVYSRVVGYLRPVDQWNEGKQAEFEKRCTFSVSPQETAG